MGPNNNNLINSKHSLIIKVALNYFKYPFKQNLVCTQSVTHYLSYSQKVWEPLMYSKVYVGDPGHFGTLMVVTASPIFRTLALEIRITP